MVVVAAVVREKVMVVTGVACVSESERDRDISHTLVRHNTPDSHTCIDGPQHQAFLTCIQPRK